MGIKKYKPTSPGRRNMSSADFDQITAAEPHKKLVVKKSKTGGRNNLGRITCRHRGGGHKRRYRLIDFKRNKYGVPANVATVEYDPNRSARIALLHYADGEKRYILAPDGMKPGQQVVSSAKADIMPGNAMPMSAMPLGTQVHNVEMKPGKGGQLARSAGASAQLMAKEGRYALLRLPSGELRQVLARCRATIGVVGNLHHAQVDQGKAGRKRWLGIRPTVRGVAMNPVDHPHGGGEGRTSGGRHPVSKWGVPTKGHTTRKNTRTDRFIVKRRKKK